MNKNILWEATDYIKSKIKIMIYNIIYKWYAIPPYIRSLLTDTHTHTHLHTRTFRGSIVKTFTNISVFVWIYNM